MFKTVNTFKLCKFINDKFVNLNKNACFCINRCEGSYSSDEPPKPENPVKRTLRILGNDMKFAQNKVQSFIESVQSIRELASKGIKSPYQDGVLKSPHRDGVFPEHCDIAIIGGGAMGSSIAYWLKQRAPNAVTVTVIEKDPTVNQNILLWGQVNIIIIFFFPIYLQSVTSRVTIGKCFDA
jgi:hypothetical protein